MIPKPVLVIEDHRTLGLILKTMIEERWGCRVDLVTSLAEARRNLQAEKEYLLAVCDLDLPDTSCDSILQCLQSFDIPMVALVSQLYGELREKILSANIVDYVFKDSINAYNYIAELIGRFARNQGIRALVVDTCSQGDRLSGFSQRIGLQVLKAENGKHALEVLKRQSEIGLMLVAESAFKQGGIELILEARKCYGKDRLAIMVISDSQDPIEVSRALKYGANDIIIAPVNFEEFVCRVNQHLEVLELIEFNSNAANLDFLTQLYNRRRFFDFGKTELTSALQRRESVVVGILDLDFFKSINDSYGHEMGDLVLKKVAALLKTKFADHLVARLGGEEFALVLTGQSAAQAMDRFEDFRVALQETEFYAGDKKFCVTASIGMCQAEIDDLGVLLYLADTKLYEAKANGRNQIVA